jgi:EpsI family protein
LAITANAVRPVDAAGIPALTALGVVLGVHLLVHWPDVVSLSDNWAHNDAYSHGYLAGPVLAWLIWDARGRLEIESAPPVRWVAFAVLILGLVWAFAYAAAIGLVRELLWPATGWLLVLGLLGRQAALALAVPFAWLYTCVPIWGPLAPPLQKTTAIVSHELIRLVGVPAYLDGTRIMVPAGTFDVAAGCSGGNFFVVSLALSLLYGQLTAASVANRIKLVAIALSLALVANWMRVVIVILAGNATAMRSPLVDHHYGFGWVLFAGTLVLFLLLASRMTGRAQRPAGVREPIQSSRSAVSWWATMTLIVAMTIGPAWAYAHAWLAESVQIPRLGALPYETQDFNAVPEPVDAWQPLLPAARLELRAAFSDGARTAVLDVRGYGRQAHGAKLIGYDSHLEGGKGWRLASSDVPLGAAVRVVSPIGVYWIVRPWYAIAGRVTGDARQAQWDGARSLLSSRQDARLIAIAAPCARDCVSDGSEERLTAFARAIRPAFRDRGIDLGE